MARIGSGIADAAVYGIQPGNYIIREAESVVHRPKPQEGRELLDPGLKVRLVFEACDEDWNTDVTIGKDGMVETYLGCGAKALSEVHPGVAEDEDDENPEDQGSEVDATGNTFWIEKGSRFKFSAQTVWMIFSTSLEKAGVDMSASYLPNLIGLRVTLELEHKSGKSADGKEIKYDAPVVVKIWPEEKKGKAGKAGKESKKEDKTAKQQKVSKPEKAEKLKSATPDEDEEEEDGDEEAKTNKSVKSAKSSYGKVLKTIWDALSAELEGETLTYKAVVKKVGAKLQLPKFKVENPEEALAEFTRDYEAITKNESGEEVEF